MRLPGLGTHVVVCVGMASAGCAREGRPVSVTTSPEPRDLCETVERG
jgi:hypothetical protein